jgi:hypothetical protein
MTPIQATANNLGSASAGWPVPTRCPCVPGPWSTSIRNASRSIRRTLGQVPKCLLCNRVRLQPRTGRREARLSLCNEGSPARVLVTFAPSGRPDPIHRIRAIRASQAGRCMPARSSRRRTLYSASSGGPIRCNSCKGGCSPGSCSSRGCDPLGSDPASPRGVHARGSGSADPTVRSRQVSAPHHSNTCSDGRPMGSGVR